IIPGLPLPPATDLGSQAVRLKRNESVIAEAQKARKGLWRIGFVAKRSATDVASAFSTMGHAAASIIGERSVNAVRHFESLPRKKQILWVAAPYAVVLFLVLLLIFLKEPSKAGATVIAPKMQAASMQALAPQPAAPAPAPATPVQPQAAVQ